MEQRRRFKQKLTFFERCSEEAEASKPNQPLIWNVGCGRLS